MRTTYTRSLGTVLKTETTEKKMRSIAKMPHPVAPPTSTEISHCYAMHDSFSSPKDMKLTTHLPLSQKPCRPITLFHLTSQTVTSDAKIKGLGKAAMLIRHIRGHYNAPTSHEHHQVINGQISLKTQESRGRYSKSDHDRAFSHVPPNSKTRPPAPAWPRLNSATCESHP